MPLTKEKILSDYNYYKEKAFIYFDKNEINIAVKHMELTARIGYKYNFRYSDDEIENLIEIIGKEIIHTKISYERKPNKIVFYDSLSNDNRALTQQYIRALINANYELLYITSKEKIGIDIYEELKNYQKAEVLIIRGNSINEKIENSLEKIMSFQPSKAFLHFTPWDILGFVLWSQLKGLERYFINLTDHAYWLGKNTADYFLEFRKYGAWLSVNHRKIPIEKLLFQSYYPLETGKKFAGFPVDTNNRVIAFAGSNFNKVYGDNFTFFNLIKDVLKNNPKLIFFFAGNGNCKPFINFIKKNNLQSKLIYIGNRSDIDEVIKRVDIYVNTYPIIGGLMSSYAAIHNIPIIGYTDEILFDFNNTYDLLDIPDNGRIVITSKKDFLSLFTALVNDLEERRKNMVDIKNSIISKSNFDQLLIQNIKYQKNRITIDGYEPKIDLEKVFNLYYDITVNYLKDHHLLIYSSLKYELFRCKMSIIMKTLYCAMCEKIKNKFYKILNKQSQHR
jgi:hypothetical protein